MAKFRTVEEITFAFLDYLRLAQPDADTKPGSVIRDLLIDMPAAELAKLYTELRNSNTFQSVLTATGSDLDRYARNFGITRNSGSPAFGVAVLTTNTLDTDIVVPVGTIFVARNGATFKTITDALFSSTKKSLYRSNQIRLQTDLELAGIVDQFALEVGVQATAPGTAGRLSKFGLISQPIAGVSNVTNIEAFSGGTSSETDDQFRARILSVFAGSNIGTSLGYLNAAKSDSRVTDALVIEPGDPLMTRDGSDIGTDADGNPVVVQSGTGGKVDVIVQGSDFQSTSESFIYQDKSGHSDPTDTANDFILGQRGINSELDYAQKRRLYFQQGILPYQPAGQILSISGSQSGPNFTEAFVENGIQKGSFELKKDTGVFGGSAFGFDKIHFISNEIDLADEQLTKTQFNSQDPLDYTDVQVISAADQTINLSREVATVDATDRSLITLRHTPVLSVDRVVNLTTGERYRIVAQNPDGVTGEPNTTGRIKIAGGTLPTISDIVEVNYGWTLQYDKYLDFDSLEKDSVVRTAQDSVDWGFANRVIAEQSEMLFSVADGYHVIVTHPVSRVVNVNTLSQETVLSSAGKLTVSSIISNVVSVKDSAGREVFYTALSDGSFSGMEITLPTDTILPNSSSAVVQYNSEDQFSPEGTDSGIFTGNVIKLTSYTGSAGVTVYVDYVANVNTLLPTSSLSNLPAVGTENQFAVNGSIVGDQPVSNIYLSDLSISRNLRFSPSYLRMVFAGLVASGRLLVRGTAYQQIEQTFVCLQDGLTVDLNLAIQSALGSVPSGSYVAKLEKLERVTVVDGEVTAVEHSFDVLNYELANTTYSNQTGFENSSLTDTQIKLSATSDNQAEAPTSGIYLRAVFGLVSSQTERISISVSGTQITKYKYVFVDRVAVESGFTGLTGTITGTIAVFPFTQPVSGSQYFADYSYTAPKEGERLTINYTYNRLVSTLIGVLEPVRPVTADVLVRSAEQVNVDVSVDIIADPNFTGSNTNLSQATNERIVSFINGLGLGATLDNSDLIAALYGVSGIDRVTITKFNFEGESGIQRTIQADRDQFLTAGTILVNIGTR